MASIRNHVIDQGSTFTFSIVISDSNDNPLDLSGFTFRSQIRRSYASTSYVAMEVTATTDLTDGDITLALSAYDTARLKEGRYVYDVEIISPASVVTRVLEGIITVNPGVTRVSPTTTTTTLP